MPRKLALITGLFLPYLDPIAGALRLGLVTSGGDKKSYRLPRDVVNHRSNCCASLRLVSSKSVDHKTRPKYGGVVLMDAVDYGTWRENVIAEIEENASSTEKGDRFVQRVLRDRYEFSDDDAVNATEFAGTGDRGVDAIHIEPADEDTPPLVLVVQGKYGAAADTLSPVTEFGKFQHALESALAGEPPTDAIARCASVLNSGGLVTYVIASLDPLTEGQLQQVDDARVIARDRFGERVLIELVVLSEVYEQLSDKPTAATSVELHCQGVELSPTVFVGAASLVDVYLMLRQYTDSHHGVLNSIYDRNVRKWLGGRLRSINAGIADTLEKEPENFITYNNGITIVCHSFTWSNGMLTIHSPNIVNGCQTTRTVYDFMENRFAGLAKVLQNRQDASIYRKSSLTFKLVAVENLDDKLVKNITTYSNKQNAVRGRDFLTLQEAFRQFQMVLRKDYGYYLEST